MKPVWTPKYRALPRHPWKPDGPWRVVRVKTGFEAVFVKDDMTCLDAICLRLKLEFGKATTNDH